MNTNPPESHLMFACPHCRVNMSLHPSQAGTVIVCPGCQGKFQAPMPVAQTEGLPGSSSPANPPSQIGMQEFASKRITAGICGIVFGGLGVHKFYLGFNSAGLIMLSICMVGFVLGVCFVVPLLASTAIGIIGIVEGVIYLTKSDEEFYQTYAVERKEWF